MPSDLQTPTAEPVRFTRWLAAILAGAFIAILLMVSAFWAFTGFGLFEVGRMLRGGQMHINVDQPTVVRQIRALQRLETVSYTMDKIIVGERENPILPKFLAGDRLLLVVHGEVIAGVDLAKLQPGDVQVSGKSAFIKLPPAEIFTTRLDNEKTRVFSRDTGLFTTPDPNLESQVREEADRQITAAALQDGILNTASVKAQQTISSLLAGLGFEHVTVK